MKYKFKPSHVVPAFLFVVAVLYGGSKPPMPTNMPPDDASSPTNDVETVGGGISEGGSGVLAACQEGEIPYSNRLDSAFSLTGRLEVAHGALFVTSGEDAASPLEFASISNWTARGAYCDWQRVDFHDGFRFPVGTNFIDAVTLFAYGEVGRVAPRPPEMESTNSTPAAMGLAALPMRVSLEPNVSSVTHGLTPSNSYLFAWHNCCAERSPTNRVNASIELFRSGAVAIRTTSTVQPSTFDLQPPIVPEGYYGNGQDEDWIRATFPDEADTILAQGYDSWLLNTWTGINAENGHCLVRVTIDPSAFNQQPATINQQPIYLACGPYKVNVTEPGTYGFPLEVFEQYEARTYPAAVPLAFEYDDGYRGEGGPSYEIVDAAERPRLLMAPRLTGWLPDCIYRFFMRPKVVVTPNRVSLDEAEGKVLDLWVNVTNTIERSWSCFSYNTRLSFTRNQAVIDAARVAELTEILLEQDRRIARGELEITPLPIDESQVETNRFDATIFEGETWHTSETNDLYIKYFTVPTEVGTTNEVLDTNVYGPPQGRSVYVGVFMATTEVPGDAAGCEDDRISWRVLVNNQELMAGASSVDEHSDELEDVIMQQKRIYGIGYGVVYLGGCRVDPPNGDDFGIRLIGTAQNVGDGLRQTCLQIGIFPIDDNGAVVGWPDWAAR